jgi:hypothetical protein
MLRNLRLPVIDIVRAGRIIQVWVLWAMGLKQESLLVGVHSNLQAQWSRLCSPLLLATRKQRVSKEETGKALQ